MAKDKQEIEWKPTCEFAPKQAQFKKSGVMVVLEKEVSKIGAGGLKVASKPQKTCIIKIGADGKGYMAANEKEEKRLLEIVQSEDPMINGPAGICLMKDRQMPAPQKKAELRAEEEKQKRMQTEGKLKSLEQQAASLGFTLDEDGKLVKA